jgi:Beta-galactosidase trimerisation domain/Hypothetical glycosyl hydrolase 6
MSLSRRDLLQSAGLALAASQLGAGADSEPAVPDWIRTCRSLICEAYNPPFYPSLDYQPAKAVSIAQQLNADSLRYPAASYFAYFPTKSGYPIHPELKRDPMRETIDLCKRAGLKAIAYVPLNHPFMDATSGDPRYREWCKKSADGTPMTTEHYGFAKYFEGCLNSPVRDVIRELVREVLTQYPVDVMYFDGPYQGMQMAKEYCHCKYCEAAYQKRFGKPVPNQDQKLSREDEVQYTLWMANEVAIAFLAEIRQMIRQTRDVPVLFNDTSLLSKREWRNRAIPVVDGFMFEAAETPEDKLFNLQLGHSTGKVIWTYVGTHTQYNREHMKSDRTRGWFSYPVESQELLLDGATAIAGGAGIVYWGLSRFFYMPEGPQSYDSGRYVKETFDFSQKHRALLDAVKARPIAGVIVGDQTIDWFTGRHYVAKGYENYYHGAWQALKDLGYDSEPFLDWMMTADQLRRYKLVWAANTACLSDGQCALLRDYVEQGGTLIATHLTSVADEHGKMRGNFGLAHVFGAKFTSVEPIEIPDLYLRLPGGEEIPQDPQVLRFSTIGESAVLAETIDRGHRANLGPAIVRRAFGKGQVIYIGSGLDAIYAETRMQRLRTYLGSLIDPLLKAHRTYEVEWQSGVVPHLMVSGSTILLHLLADTGNKFKKLRAREEFLPVENVKVRIRIPDGRNVKSVSLLRAGRTLRAPARNGWIEATIPRVLIHEAVRVDLA